MKISSAISVRGQVVIPKALREARAILGENAARLYGFDLEKLAPLCEKYAPTPGELSVPLAEHEFPQKVHTAAFRR